MFGGLVGERRDVQTAQRDDDASSAVGVGEAVGALRAGDVDLDDDEIGCVVLADRRDVLVLDDGLVVGREVRGQHRQSQRRKERILDRPPVRTGGFGQRRQDELDAKRSHDRL
jgi:hypothetical protein